MSRTSKLLSSQSRPKKSTVCVRIGCFWLLLLMFGFWVTKINVQNITPDDAQLLPAGQTSSMQQPPETQTPQAAETTPETQETTRQETAPETQETTQQETAPETQETTRRESEVPEPAPTPETQTQQSPPPAGTNGAAAPDSPGVPEDTVARYAGVTMSKAELRELVSVIFLEAGTQSLRGQQAYAEVVLNRVIAKNFPNTVHDVLYQGTGTAVPQFSAVPQIPAAAPTGMQYRAVALALSGPSILPEDVVYCSQAGENKYVWGSIGDLVFCYQYEWARDGSVQVK